MMELECQIQGQLSRFKNAELTAPPWTVLSQLPDYCFRILAADGLPSHPVALIDELPLEEKILELELDKQYPNRQATITVFRKSEVAFRLVSTTKDEQNNSFDRESLDINMAHTRLIPTFAASKDSSNANNSLYLWPNHIQPYCYTLVDPKSVHEFQRALLGHRVSHEMSNIKWCIEYQAMGKRGMSGNAKLQFWQPKPLSKKLSYSEPPPVDDPGSSAVKDASSPSSSVKPRQLHRSTASQPTRSVIESRVSGSCGDGIALLRREPPALIFFTECEKRYSFLHLKCMARKTCLDFILY